MSDNFGIGTKAEKEQIPMDVSGHSEREMSADPRALRTRAALKQGLMQLLQDADWGEITTSGICRRARIARSSFYEHYSAKADVLDDVFADRMSDIRLSFRPGEPLGTLNWLVDHVAEAPDFFAHAMAGGRGDALLPRFRAALIRKLEDELTLRGVTDAGPKAAYLIGGSMAYLAAVPKRDNRAALQEFASRLVE